ncbi:hypothetical protein [Aquabacter spiritensis]|uniref:Uncharacterized protein n=1 Tax=Aquabacter spiritensis TaxID=933073 RepID=A0A4R3LMU6_9HYPH|nr:hypothetical protein [Aquabacter spiritensis]TCT01654.1 hypothetical protein EDC64_1175 [Aquabacter spiritensis]
MTDRPTAYPDDLNQSRADQRDPPIAHAAAQGGRRPVTGIADHAALHQGGGPTGEVGGDRPAETTSSPIGRIGGRDVLPGADPEARGERHWAAPLPHPIRLQTADAAELRTLRDAGALLSGQITVLVHSAALQAAAHALIRAAATGDASDITTAADLLGVVLRTEGLV